MSKVLQPVRGTHDILPEEADRRRFITGLARRRAALYGYREMATPVFEFSEVFHRTLGETSDVIGKETYSFEDRGGESLTLRPEFTAAVVRAFLSNGMQQELPCKFFYHGPAFRYERPQKGRQRQFHQFGVEMLGVAEPQADVEMIALGWDILEHLGLREHITLQINTLGTSASRQKLRSDLQKALYPYLAKLSEDSQVRLERNPLRILDSKNPGDRETIAVSGTAAIVKDYISGPEVKPFYDEVKTGLEALGIPYTENPNLVRGLDYYCHTVFEFTCEGLGAQDTVLAGGRYDGLVELMGGPPTPGIGFAAGIERLLLAVDFANHPQFPKAARPVAIIPLGDAAERQAMILAQALRGQDIPVELGATGNMQKRMKRANKVNAVAAVILGEDELAKGIATLKDLDSGSQSEVKLRDLATVLAGLLE